jgi:hypothetical protein
VYNRVPPGGGKETDHLVATADEDGHGPGVGAVLNDQHLFPCGAEGHLADNAGAAQLLRLEVFEPGHYPAVGGNSNKLDLRTAHPPYGGELVLKEEMVGLVVETPLTYGKVGSGVLYLLDHLDESIPLVVLQLPVLLHTCDVQLMLGLGLWGLESACEDGNLGVLDLGRHLRVREVLIDDDALDEDRVLQSSSNLAIDLDQLEVDVFPLQIGD